MSAAHDFLVKLFKRAENTRSRGQTKLTPLPLTPAQCPAYFEMRSLEEAAEFRAHLSVAERKGAITITQDPRLKHPRDVRSVKAMDLAVLAEHLGMELRSGQVAKANVLLSSYVGDFPVLSSVIDAWDKGKKVRGEEPGSEVLMDLKEAVTVMLDRRGASEEVLMRRQSARLFNCSNGSKRIEKLGKWLDVLYTNDLSPSGLEQDEVFSALGLHREPQPFLISANGFVSGTGVESRLFRPYHGLPTSSIEGFRFEALPSCVLTVENKQTFHELAVLTEGSQACVVYTGGMPSPAWHQVYAKLLKTIPLAAAKVYHFGDLDVGGFRIAYTIAQTVNATGHHLLPWLMDPVQLKGQGHRLFEASKNQVGHMKRWCSRIGWETLAENISLAPGLLEQEAIRPAIPGVLFAA